MQRRARRCARLAEQHKDGETLGLFARTWKDEWTQVWNTHPQRTTDPLAAARDTAATLQSAAVAYVDAFRADAANYYPGINALTLGRLWEHVTGRKSKLPLDLIAAGVSWCTAVAVERDKDYWSLATRAELALVENRKDEALDDYDEAAALAVANRDRFALDSSEPAARLPGRRSAFRPEIVAEAALDHRSRRDSSSTRCSGPGKPRRRRAEARHRLQRPHDRQPRRARRRQGEAAAFPADEDRCGGGRDSRPARQDRRRRRRPRPVRRRLGRRPAVRRSLPRARHAPGAAPRPGGSRVPRRVGDLRRPRSSLGAQLRARHGRSRHDASSSCREELGPAPEGVSVHDRCNRWILYSALSCGLSKTSFVTLWNGEPGDGPGGTEHMVELVRTLTGRQPEIIDPATL